MPRVLPNVQHWLSCTTAEASAEVRWDSPFRLEGVRYWHTGAADFTSPQPSLPRLDVFARFFNGEGRTDFEVRVSWVGDAGKSPPEVVAVYGPVRADFDAGEPVRDFVFRLAPVPAPHPGAYTAELVALPPLDEAGRPDSSGGGEVLATEYFYLVGES